MSFCNASVELRCTGTGVESGGGFCGQVATCYFYWWRNCVVWVETAVIDSDKHYVTSPKERLTGFFVGWKTLQTVAPRRVIMLLSYQYSLLYLHHTRIQTACCLTLSFCSVVRTIKIAYNIFIKELLYSAFSISRYTINKEQSINAPFFMFFLTVHHSTDFWKYQLSAQFF